MIDCFDGAVAISYWPLFFSVLVIIHFVYSYRKNCLIEGYKIDFWHYKTAYGYIFTIFLMYPFAGSYFNAFAVGSNVEIIRDHINEAFWITSVGYIGHYSGFYIYNYGDKKSVVSFVNNAGAKYLYLTGNSKILLESGALFLCLLSIAGIIYTYTKEGISFNARGYFLSDSSIRPFFNFWFSMIYFISTLVILRLIMYREKIFIFIAIFFAVTSLLSGTRIIIFSPIQTVAVYYLISLRKNAPILKSVFFALLLLLVAVLVGVVRSNLSIDNIPVVIGMSIVYGNNFSDLRDFAWVLSYWDGALLVGKSYLAGIMALVPRSLSDFREAYSIGVYTNKFLGFDSTTHPGLRPGPFGEAYINFGILGVMTVGLISGYVLRLTDAQIKKVVETEQTNYLKMHSRTFLHGMTTYLHITAGFFSFYVETLLLVTVLLTVKVAGRIRRT